MVGGGGGGGTGEAGLQPVEIILTCAGKLSLSFI